MHPDIQGDAGWRFSNDRYWLDKSASAGSEIAVKQVRVLFYCWPQMGTLIFKCVDQIYFVKLETPTRNTANSSHLCWRCFYFLFADFAFLNVVAQFKLI
jgi:hypothetical protein